MDTNTSGTQTPTTVELDELDILGEDTCQDVVVYHDEAVHLGQTPMTLDELVEDVALYLDCIGTPDVDRTALRTFVQNNFSSLLVRS